MRFLWTKKGLQHLATAAEGLEWLTHQAILKLYQNDVSYLFDGLVPADFTPANYTGVNAIDFSDEAPSGPWYDADEQAVYFKTVGADFGKNTGTEQTQYGVVMISGDLAQVWGVMVFDDPLLIPVGGELFVNFLFGSGQNPEDSTMELDVA